MFGVIESVMIVVISIILMALFGRKAFKELLRIALGAKQDVEEVKKEFQPKTSKQK